MPTKPTAKGAISRQEAVAARYEMLEHAARCAKRAADPGLRFGLRYEAAVIGDHCLDVAKEYDAYIRDMDRLRS